MEEEILEDSRSTHARSGRVRDQQHPNPKGIATAYRVLKHRSNEISSKM